MRFKVDENLHPEAVALLAEHGHDAVSVWDQKVQGVKDPRLASLCRDERRILLTFDVGFGDIRQYPPLEWPGFVVLRLGSQSRAHVVGVLRRVIPLFLTLPLAGRLWVVTDHDVRIRGGAEEAGTEI